MRLSFDELRQNPHARGYVGGVPAPEQFLPLDVELTAVQVMRAAACAKGCLGKLEAETSTVTFYELADPTLQAQSPRDLRPDPPVTSAVISPVSRTDLALISH